MARSWFNLDHPQIIAYPHDHCQPRKCGPCDIFTWDARFYEQLHATSARARLCKHACPMQHAVARSRARAVFRLGGERRTRSHFGVPYGEVYGDDCRQCPLGYGYGTSPHCGHWTRSSNDGGAETNVARGNGAAAIGAVPFSSSSSSSPPSSSSPSSSSALSPLPQPLS